MDQLEREVARLRAEIADLQEMKREHERLVAELKQSEAQFRKLTEKSVVGVYLIQDDLLRYVNPTFAEIFGYEVDEIVDKMDAMALVRPEDRPVVEENVRKRISGEVDAINFKWLGVRKSGEHIHLEAYGSRVNHNGKPAVIGTLVDITERVHAEMELERQLNKFQALYDLALAMTAEHSLDENLTLIVDKSRETLGTDTAFVALRDEEAEELHWHIASGLKTEVFRGLRVPMGAGLAGRVAAAGEPLIIEDYFEQVSSDFHEQTRAEGLISGIAAPVQIGRTNLGVLFAFDRKRTPFSKSDLDTLSLFGNLAAVEITRNRASQQLLESQERYRRLYEESRRGEELYRSVLNSSADAIVVYDMDGVAKYVSPSFTRIFGWKKEEVVGKRIPFVPDSERERSLASIGKVLDEGKPSTGFETRRLRKDGSIIHVSISSSRYHDHEGKPAGILVVLRDITALKSIEEARKTAVHHLSHELITPLALVEASARKLARPDISDNLREKNIQRLLRNLGRLKDIQHVVQEIIRPREYKPRSFPLIGTIEKILEDLRRASAHRSVELVFRGESFATDIIDPLILEEVLRTLVKNAIENTPDEGKVHVTLAKAPEGVLLEVIDHGVGITAGDREFIFKAFHHTQDTQLYSTKKPYDFNAGGKGLELMRLKVLAEHGSFDIAFESHRCGYIPSGRDNCCGRISKCRHVGSEEECRESGGTTFSVLFSHPEHLG
jgi:two-component system phosphate regulon sensor histidine kinase PhoR